MEQHPECSIDSQGAERPASEELQEIPADSLSPVLYIDDQGGSPPALEEVQEDSIPADDIPEDIDVRRATPPAVEEVQKIRRPALILGFYVDVQDASPRALQELQDNLIPGDNIPEHDNDVLRASPPALEEEQDNPIPADDIPESSDVQCATAPVSNEEEGIPGDNIPEYLDDQEASPPATLEDIQYIPLPDDMSDYYDVPRNGKRSASDEEQEMLRDALIRSAKRIKDEEEQDNPIPADDNSRSGCFAIKNMGRDQVPGTSTDATPRKKNLLKLKIFKLRRQLKINRFRSRLQTKALRENLEALRSEVTRTTALLVYERERRILADEKAETAVKTMGQIMESNFYCSICNQAFINAILLNCAHTFCKYCITMWQRTRNNCPICRAPVTVKSSNLVVDGFIEYLTINLSPEVHSLREKQLQSRQEEWDALARLPGGPLSPVQPPNHLRVPLPREREGEDIVRVPNATLLASYRSSRPQEPRNPTVPSRPQTPTSPTAPDDTLTPYRPMGSIWHLVLMRHNAMVRSLLQTSEPAPVNITPEQIVLAAPARPQPQPRFSATHTNPEPIRPLPPFRPRVLTRAPASNAYTRYNRVLANNRFMQLARPPALDMNPEPIRPLPPTRYRGLIRAPASNAYTEYNRVLANNRFMQLARPLALDMNPEPIRPLPPTRYRGLTRAPASNAYTV